jgi:hypothetical protein
VPLLSARLSAARAAAFITLAGVAGISCVTAGQAAQPPRRPAPVQRAAPVHRPAPVQRAAPRVSTPQVHVNRPVQVAPRFTQSQNAKRNLRTVNPSLQRDNPNVRPNSPGVQQVHPSVQRVNPNAQRLNPNLAQPKAGLPLRGANALRLGPGKPVVNPASLGRGPGGLQQIKPAFPAVSIHDRFWPIHRDRRFVWIGGHRRFFIPVGLLGVALIGGSYWDPDAYVSIDGPACTGFTPDGCQLHWRMVDFEDGGGEPQCVQYCPRVGPPPAAAAPLPPPPAFAANGACQLTIFSEPNFAGLSAPTGDSQPDLSQSGWRNEIASIQVQAGTWDFFDGENFGGESMRLSAGPYPTLAPEWSKRIGSFMCVQPGLPGA